MSQQLANDGTPLKLTFEQVTEQFHKLIWFAAKQQISNYPTDTMSSIDDLYQEGLIKLYDCWEIWCQDKNKDMDEFGPIFRKSLFRVMKKGNSTRKPNFVDIDDAVGDALIDGDTPADSVDRMHREKGLMELANSLSDTGRRLLEELADPSARTLYEVWADTQRKMMLRSQGKRVNIPKDGTVRMKHIIRSMGITQKQYDLCMIEIRENAKLFVER